MNYTLDNAAREAKEKEIEAILATLAEGHAVLDPRQTQKLIGSFVTVTPPLLPPPVIKRITISELVGATGGDRVRATGSDFYILTILRTFGVIDLVVASLKAFFKPFKASRLFHVQGSMFTGVKAEARSKRSSRSNRSRRLIAEIGSGELARFDNSQNVEMSKRKHMRDLSRLIKIVESEKCEPKDF